MKISPILAAALLVASVSARAEDLTVLDSSYSLASYYSDPQSNNIVSYDWTSSGSLVYMSGDPYGDFTGVYSVSSGVNTTIDPANTGYAGANVATIGNYTYYNFSDSNFNEYINQYGPTNGTPALTLASTAPNYGIYAHNGQMFITAGDSNGVNDIYYSNINSDGTLAGIVDLGVTSGDSGPLAFDTAGDLFYAPGYGDSSIYKWSAAEVAAAIANPTLDPLTVAGHLWDDYSSTYSGESGATSMLFANDGDLLVTLTSFDGPSVLVDFTPDAQTATTILSGSTGLGELRDQNGSLYLSAGSQIDQLNVVPEPSASLLSFLGIGVALLVRQIRKTKSLA